jgi:hypothetical protein
MDAWTYLYATLVDRPWEKKKQKKRKKRKGKAIADENVYEPDVSEPSEGITTQEVSASA